MKGIRQIQMATSISDVIAAILHSTSQQAPQSLTSPLCTTSIKSDKKTGSEADKSQEKRSLELPTLPCKLQKQSETTSTQSGRRHIVALKSHAQPLTCLFSYFSFVQYSVVLCPGTASQD